MTKENKLQQMYVSPKARGSGVAQALMEDAENRISTAGHPMAWLACAVGNGPASRFDEKSGWTNAGRHVVALDTSDGAFPLEVWRFEKQLSTSNVG
ncbi:GNAT family N-acetyltransferase [Aestuariibius sp. 2305UL40-4]|uniref:GNAT family N-acetyltransferase n=1 Tax=Aestuariibius violaceus TaxID=3234132 RepID=UPI00345ED177